MFCIASQEMKREDCGGYFQRVADPKGWMSVAARDEEIAGELERWMEEEVGRGVNG